MGTVWANVLYFNSQRFYASSGGGRLNLQTQSVLGSIISIGSPYFGIAV